MTGTAGEPLARPRVLLTGDASARPDGLERALTRAGFQSAKPRRGRPSRRRTLSSPRCGRGPRPLRHLLADAHRAPAHRRLRPRGPRCPRGGDGAGGRGRARRAGASPRPLCQDRRADPDRQAPVRTPYEARVRDSLQDLVEEARTLLQPDEVAQALVRRLGRALDLAHCAYVMIRSGEDEGPSSPTSPRRGASMRGSTWRGTPRSARRSAAAGRSRCPTAPRPAAAPRASWCRSCWMTRWPRC